MTNEKYDTLRIHAGYRPEAHQYASSVPIYETAAFVLGDAKSAEDIVNGRSKGRYSYSRVGNPTVKVFEERIAALEGGIGAVAVGSGMSAITYTILNVAEGGGRIIAPTNIYGAGLDEFRTLLPKFNIDFDLYDQVNDLQTVKNLIKKDTKAIYVESVANPSTEIADIEALAQTAHEANIPLIVDNTFPTSYLFKPFEFGADITVYSSTKGINGHGNEISGLIVDRGQFDWGNGKFPQFEEDEFVLGNEELNEKSSFVERFGKQAFIARIRTKYLRLFGSVLSPFDAYLALIGLETISERLDKEVKSTTKIAHYLSNNAHVKHVYYSGSDPSNKLVEKYFPKGIGSILAFEIVGTDQQVNQLLDAVRVFSYLPNVGDAKSLIVNPVKTTHREIPGEIRKTQGLNSHVIRLSIGLEDIDDLIDDLDQAINQAFSN